MQRDQIIRSLEDLVPEINASQDAEGTLLKFARENNLSPAQLETLAMLKSKQKFHFLKCLVSQQTFVQELKVKPNSQWNLADTQRFLVTYRKT